MRKLFQTTVVTDPRQRFRMIRNCMFLSGLSVFAQLYLFQPMLSDLCAFFHTDLPGSSLESNSVPKRFERVGTISRLEVGEDTVTGSLSSSEPHQRISRLWSR